LYPKGTLKNASFLQSGLFPSIGKKIIGKILKAFFKKFPGVITQEQDNCVTYLN
jgi:hypothetical protein